MVGDSRKAHFLPPAGPDRPGCICCLIGFVIFFKGLTPWENGCEDRFNGTLRREIVNAEWFHSIKQAQVAIDVWLRDYNHIRPHHALGLRP